jgi:hypothetical protein
LARLIHTLLEGADTWLHALLLARKRVGALLGAPV